MPSANAKPLSTIVQAIETRETGTITEVDCDHGFWEVELRRDGRHSGDAARLGSDRVDSPDRVSAAAY